MEMIELFEHNEEAYQSLVKSLQYSNFSFLERATGTGKSYILIKFIANFFKNKRVLFVTLHDSMFRQLIENDMPALGTSKDIYQKLDCILYKSIDKHNAQWYVDNYDCIIFDEAHHCGASKWGKTIAQIRDLIKESPDKVMIGATATGTRYLDDYRDVAKEFFEDNVASRLYLPEAILRHILPAPFYINVNKTSLDKINEIKRKLRRLEGYTELDPMKKQLSDIQEKVKIETNPNHLFKKYHVQKGEKFILFCNNIEELERKKAEVAEWFKDIAPLEIYDVHNQKSPNVNLKTIKAFEQNNNPNKIKIMLAVDMFNEGLHIKGVTGIIMNRKTTSPIVYLQQLGRALSFSSRNNQIKIFDLVGNATNIDVIQNLYNELIALAKEEVKNHPENSQHFQQIIDRFKIVDEGSELLQKLEKINKYIDDNYFNKEKIDRCIFILKNYISTLNVNFMDLVHTGKLDADHFKVYKQLQKLSKLLTYEQLVELTSLGVVVGKYQQDEEMMMQIKKHGNFKKVAENDIEQTMYQYNLYYLKNNCRPDRNDPLTIKYREYLNSLKPQKLKSYLNQCNYPLNVEEIIVLKEYPTKEAIESYLKQMEEKYQNGISLDSLEQKALSYINRLLPEKEKTLIMNIFNDKTIKIDEIIRILKDYRLEHPNDNLDIVKDYYDGYEIKQALETLNRYAQHVTNAQFVVLLELRIPLPSSINMTLEQRKKELGNFQSFYEKAQFRSMSTFNILREFINRQKRRPSKEIEEEKELYYTYQEFINQNSNVWKTALIKILVENEIPLTAAEKILYNVRLTPEENKHIYDEVYKELLDCNPRTFNANTMKKKIKILDSNGYIDDKLYRIFLRTCSFIEYIFEKQEHDFQKDLVLKHIRNNQAIIPFGMEEFIQKKYGLSVFKNETRKYNGVPLINRVHKRYLEMNQNLKEYFEEIEKTKKRPENAELNKKIRAYLATATQKEIQNFANRLNASQIPLNKEEMCLIKMMSSQQKQEYFLELGQKKQNGLPLDQLENRVYYILRTNQGNENLDNDIITEPSLIEEMNNELKEERFQEFKRKIENNPLEKINYEHTNFSDEEKKLLERFRLVCLSESFLKKVIKKIEEQNKTYEEILSKEERTLLENVIQLCISQSLHLELIDCLTKTNRKIMTDTKKINPEEFIQEYLTFIEKNHHLPAGDSKDKKETDLFKTYETIQSALSPNEKKDFLKAIKTYMSNAEKSQKYNQLVDFIQKNERFPSALSDDEEEKKLARLYQEYGAKFSTDQKKQINALLKKYQMNTIRYAQKRGGIINGKNRL